MNDIVTFYGVDVVGESRKILESAKDSITKEMTESEKKLYDMGVLNSLNAVAAIVDNDEQYVVNIQGEEPEGYTYKELLDKFYK